MRSPSTRLVSWLLLPMALGACTRWVPTNVPPQALIDRDQPSTVRVRTADGSQTKIDDPVIRSDSISAPVESCERSFTADGRTECAGRASVALDDVREIEVAHADPLRSVGAAGLVLVGLYGVILGLLAISGGPLR